MHAEGHAVPAERHLAHAGGPAVPAARHAVPAEGHAVHAATCAVHAGDHAQHPAGALMGLQAKGKTPQQSHDEMLLHEAVCAG